MLCLLASSTINVTNCANRVVGFSLFPKQSAGRLLSGLNWRDVVFAHVHDLLLLGISDWN